MLPKIGKNSRQTRLHFSENVSGRLLIYGKSGKSYIFVYTNASLGGNSNLLPLNLVQGGGVVGTSSRPIVLIR